jgi:hypothetical protein
LFFILEGKCCSIWSVRLPLSSWYDMLRCVGLTHGWNLGVTGTLHLSCHFYSVTCTSCPHGGEWMEGRKTFSSPLIWGLLLKTGWNLSL